MPELEGLLLHPVRNPRQGGEANAAKTSFLQAFQRPVCSGAGMQIRGAASLADVPYWRKTNVRLTVRILPRTMLFLKCWKVVSQHLTLLYSGDYIDGSFLVGASIVFRSCVKSSLYAWTIIARLCIDMAVYF
jgi:hypothetical protein